MKKVYRQLYRIAQLMVHYSRLEQATDDPIDHEFFKSRRESMNKSFYSLCKLHSIDDIRTLETMICGII